MIDPKFQAGMMARYEQLWGLKRNWWGKIKSGVYDSGALIGMLIKSLTGKRVPWFDMRGKEVCSTGIASGCQCGFLNMGLPDDTLIPGVHNTAEVFPAHGWCLIRQLPTSVDDFQIGQIIGSMHWAEPRIKELAADIMRAVIGGNALKALLGLRGNLGDGIVWAQMQYGPGQSRFFTHPSHHTVHIMQIVEITPDSVIVYSQEEVAKRKTYPKIELLAKMQGHQPYYVLWNIPVAGVQ